jgi:hypothetical protein
MASNLHPLQRRLAQFLNLKSAGKRSVLMLERPSILVQALMQVSEVNNKVVATMAPTLLKRQRQDIRQLDTESIRMPDTFLLRVMLLEQLGDTRPLQQAIQVQRSRA